MAKSCAPTLSQCGTIVVVSGAFIFFWTFIFCTVIGLNGRDEYVTNRDLRKALTRTECLLLNYTRLEHECTACETHGCRYFSCFDERLQFLYTIANQTQMMTVFEFTDQNKPHKQTEVGTDSLFEYQLRPFLCFFIQIGRNYTCLYHRREVTRVFLDLPDTQTPVIKMVVNFGTIGLSILMIILGGLCIGARKFHCSCSCFSRVPAALKKICGRARSPDRVELILESGAGPMISS